MILTRLLMSERCTTNRLEGIFWETLISTRGKELLLGRVVTRLQLCDGLLDDDLHEICRVLE